MERPGNQGHPVTEIQTERPGLQVQAHTQILKKVKNGTGYLFLEKLPVPFFCGGKSHDT